MKEQVKQWIHYQQIKDWFLRYERILMPATLVLGVLVDSLTFASIELRSAFLLLGFYTVLAGGVIGFMLAYGYYPTLITKSGFRYLSVFSPFIMQFLFGALLSGTFIFYVFSASLWASWPFILLFVLLMVGNDVFRQYYQKPLVLLSVYFFCLFSFASIFLPFVFNDLGLKYFVGASVVSVAAMSLYLYVLLRIVPSVRTMIKNVAVIVVMIVASMNTLYVFDKIPPIPLVLKESVIAHSITRVAGGNYEVSVDRSLWYDRLIPGQHIVLTPGSGMVVYTAVFAPTDLRTTIVHEWQWYDELKKEWIVQDELLFAIRGARQDGFRGFSQKSRVQAGKWRVYVKTPKGQVLGRVVFEVRESEQYPEQEIRTL